MSIVVAATDGKQVIMASDTLYTDGSHKVYGKKIIKVDNKLLVGISGDAYIFDVVQHLVDNETISYSKTGLRDFAVTAFRMAEEQMLNKNEDNALSGSILFALAPMDGLPGRIFDMSVDGSIHETTIAPADLHPGGMAYFAIGAGAGYAFGSLYKANQFPGIPTSSIGTRVLDAIKVACHFDVNCGGEVDYQCLS